MRPVLHPSLCRTWRDESTLQIGTTPGLATVLGGLGQVERSVVTAMDGQHDLRALRELAVERGGRASVADRVVDVLVSSGAAVDADLAADSRSRSAEPRLPDRSSVGLQQRSLDGGRSAMQARRTTHVDVVGAGRIGAQVARLLEAAGIGQVGVDDPLPVRPVDLSPGGHQHANLGRARDRALRSDLDQAIAPDLAASLPDSAAPQFAVLCPTTGHGRDQAAELLRLGVPHFFVQVVEITGVVGPLVVPGQSSCLRCHDLHRTDRDPHWPLILDQAIRRPPAEPACDVALATTLAGLAVTQTLAYLDGFESAAVDATIEITLPYGLPRRRTWRRHPDCGCGWD